MRPLRRLSATLDGGAGTGTRGIHANGGRHHGRGREGREEVTKPSAVLHLPRYLEWSERYGEVG